MKKVINQPDNVKNKKSSHGFGHLSQVNFLFGYFILVFILTYALPDNILDISVTLKNFVGFMAFYSPGVAKFGKYAAFPQVAQLVYSICIVTLPVMVILAYKASRNDLYKDSSAMKKRLDKILTAILSQLLFAFFFMLLIIYWFPGGPPTRHSKLWVEEMYSEKWAFSVTIIVIFACFIFLLGELFVTLNLYLHRSNINNMNK